MNIEIKILMVLGNNIRQERIKQHLSQETLAEIAGLHRTYIGMIERHERNISAVNLFKIAKALNISLDQLLPLTPENEGL